METNYKYAFCENCFDDVEYEIRENIPMSEVLKNVEYHFLGKEAYCKNCGEAVYVPEINDYNLEALYDVYRRENGIISLSIVRSIPEKYNIGKRPLSILLGWGELTFSRYYDGDIPSRQYSEILIKIYEEPEFYLKLLELGKNKIASAAYKKTKKAAESMLNIQDNKKIVLAVKYLIYKCEDITALALQKALYYSQGIYSAFYQSYMFNEDCEAWAHGPVYREIYYMYKDYKFNPIVSDSDFDESLLSKEELSVLESVANHLCCYSGKVLENFTHHEEPWISARNGVFDLSPSDAIIPKDSIKAYFSIVKDKYKMKSPKDFQLYANDMFEQFIQI